MKGEREGTREERKKFYLEVDTGASSRFSEDGDVVGISTESTDVSVHPGNSSMLIPQAVVTCKRY